MQFSPEARAGAEGKKADRLAAVAQGEDEQAGAAVLTCMGIPNHGAGAVINLGLFAGSGQDHDSGLRRLVSLELADEASNALIAAVETGVRYQVLPDGHGVAAATETEFDQLTIGFA